MFCDVSAMCSNWKHNWSARLLFNQSCSEIADPVSVVIDL